MRKEYKFVTAVALAVTLSAGQSIAQKNYGNGVSDTEIKIGQTMPYSGPASGFAVSGRTEVAYFRMINEKGGVNGRKINLVSLDDAFSPPKTVEATRRLVESEGVLFMFSSLGTQGQSAVQKYLNAKKVPQLFILSGAAKFNDPVSYPWSLPILHSYASEGQAYGQYLLANKPDAKIGILMQNDDYGREFVSGFKKALGKKADTMIVKEAKFDITDPTIDSQIIALKASGADTLFNVTIGKQTAQSLRRMSELGWSPLQFIVSTSSSKAILEGAGVNNAKGIITATPYKRLASAAWQNDPDVKVFKEFMKAHMPNDDSSDDIVLTSYSWAKLLVNILESCGDDLTAENVVAKAAGMKNVPGAALLPEITYNTNPGNYAPIHMLRVQRFNGVDWEKISDVSTD